MKKLLRKCLNSRALFPKSIKATLLGVVIATGLTNTQAQIVTYDITAAEMAGWNVGAFCASPNEHWQISFPAGLGWTSTNPATPSSIGVELYGMWYDGLGASIEFNGIPDGTLPAVAQICSNGIISFSLTPANYLPLAPNILIFRLDLTGETMVLAENIVWGPGIYARVTVDYGGAPPGPEIEVSGNSNLIVDGDVTPDPSDFTDFGNVLECTGSQSHTFVIDNIGTSDLNLNGVPIVDITGPAAFDFTVSVLPTSPVSAAGSTNFEITFDPSAVGLRQATISIANDDSDENPYNFDIQGIGDPDITPPTAACQDTTIYVDGTGNVMIDSSYVDNGSSDNCGIVSMTLSQSAFTCADLGPNLITLVVSDGAGNLDSCISTVTVMDTINPTVLCQDTTVYVDASGNAIVATSHLDNGSSDNCGLTLSLDAGLPPFTESLVMPLGNGDDGEGIAYNYSDGFIYHVSGISDGDEYFEQVDPILMTVGPNLEPGDTYGPSPAQELSGIGYDPVTGFFVAMDRDQNIYSVDAAGNFTLLSTYAGTNYLRGFAVDPLSNVYGVDPSAPNLHQFNPLTGAVITTVPLSGLAPLGGATGLTYDPLSGNTFIIAKNGPNRVLGTVDVLTGVITPIVVCGNNMSGITADGLGNIYAVSGDGASPSETLYRYSIAATDTVIYNCADLGANPLNLVGFDASGNSDTCSATVTVLDTINPTPVCSDTTIYLNASGSFTIDSSYVDGGSSDNCGITSMVLSQTNFTCANIGGNNVTMVVSDGSGNLDSCVSTVTVLDTLNPVMLCNDSIALLDSFGNVTIDSSYVALGTTDNCGIATISVSPNTFTCADVGPQTVTVYATDLSGNIDSCQSTVTIAETVPPVAVCQDTTVYLGATGLVTIDSSYVDGGSSDNCGITTMTLSQYTFTCSDVGPNTVTLTVSDFYGSNDVCNATVTVLDTIDPVITPQPDINVSADPGVCFASGISIGTATVTDNCLIDSIWNDGLTVYPVGVHTVTWTAVDEHGNMSTATQMVTVTDDENPNVVCNDITIYLDAGGNAFVSPAIDGGTTDNCGIDTMFVSQTSFDCSEVGINPVTLYAQDIHGNLDSCIANVTVMDTILPTLSVPTDLNVSADLDSCSATLSPGIAVVTDNCGVDTVYHDGPSSFPIGTTVVTWTVIDDNGNMVMDTQTITVVDDQNPVWTGTPADIIVSNNPGDCSGDATWTPPLVSDNCGILTQSSNYSSGATFPVGTTTVTYVATDVHGNADSTSFNVTVIDDEDPVITNMPSDIIVNNDSAQCGAIVSWPLPSATDNCPGLTFTPDFAPGSFFPVGTTMVTYTATDGSSNVVTSSFNVTVIDNEAPVVTVNDPDTLFADPGLCSVDQSSLNAPVVTDNCGVLSTSHDASSPIPVGTNTVTWTVLDVNGNATVVSQTVVVIDDQDPTITPPADIVMNANNAGCSGVTSLGNPVFSDNCGIASVVNDAVSPFPLGTTVVTWTVTDIWGNTATATQNVTVNQVPMTIVISATPNDTVCEMDTVTLTASGGTSYVWSDGISNGVPFVATSTNTYTVTASDVFGCTQTETFTLTVNPLPAVGYTALPDDTVCNNSMVTLNGTGAVSYTWTGGITDGVAFLLTGPGSYTVTGTDANGCSNTATANLYIRPLAIGYTAFPNDTVCEGTEVTVNGTNGSGFTWTSGVVDGVPFTPLFDYNLILTGTDTNGCTGSIPVNIIVNLNPVVNLGPDIVTSSPPVSLDAGNPGASYLWNDLNTTQIVFVNETGTYWVEVTDDNGCVGSDTINVTINYSGIEDDEDWIISIYPNPNNGVFNLDLPGLPTEKTEMTIVNNLGQVIYTSILQQQSQMFDLSYLRAGTYYIRVTSGDKVFARQIIITQKY